MLRDVVVVPLPANVAGRSLSKKEAQVTPDILSYLKVKVLFFHSRLWNGCTNLDEQNWYSHSRTGTNRYTDIDFLM